MHFIVNRESSRNVVSLLYSDLFICGSTWFNLLLIYHSSSRRREDVSNFQFVARIYAIRWKGEIVEREKEERRKFIAGTIPGEFSVDFNINARRFHRCDTVKTRASVLRFRSRFKFRRDIIYCNWKLCRTTEPRGKPTRIPRISVRFVRGRNEKIPLEQRELISLPYGLSTVPLSLIGNDNYCDLGNVKIRESSNCLNL